MEMIFNVDKTLYNTDMVHPKLYPLILSPTVKNYIWGGQKLHHLFDTDNSMDQKPVAEIWAVHGKNTIKNGFYSGYTLDQLMIERPEDLLGIITWPESRN